MSKSLLSELKNKIEEITNYESLDVESLVGELRKCPGYSKTSPIILKTCVNKIMNSKKDRKINDIEKADNQSEIGLRKREFMNDSMQNQKILKFDNNPCISFKDLGGYGKIKSEIQNFININIKNRDLYTELGIFRCPKHILINGPAGSGKSTFAAAICNEAGLNFIRLTLYDPRIYSSLSDGRMSSFFKLIKANEPAAIIIDDLDYFFTGEGTSKEAERKTLQNLLDFFDEIANSEIFIIGTVTKMEKLNNALLRSNRFEIKIDIKIPDEFDREAIINTLLQGKVTGNINSKELSFLTAGYVTSDLERLVIKTGELAIRDHLNDFTNISKNGINEDSTFIKPVDLAIPLKKKGLLIEMGHFLEALKLITPIIKNEGFTIVPNTRWDDIGALQDLKSALDKLIIKPIVNPEMCEKFGIKRQAGVLLYGPPGCGKTLLAKAVANACRANFIYVKGPELLSKYFGESEKAVRGLFERAKLTAPCLIFFDEIDGLCPKRNSEGNQVIERVVNQLLTEMNGIDDMIQIYLIGATNRPDIIDKAILRPERLGIHLYVPLPNYEDRVDILKTLLRKKPVSPTLDIDAIIQKFNFKNYSGADLNAFVEASARAAAWGDPPKNYIDLCDFDSGYKESKPSISNEDVKYYEGLKNIFK